MTWRLSITSAGLLLVLGTSAALAEPTAMTRGLESQQPVYPFGNYDFACVDAIGESTVTRTKDHRYSGQICLEDPMYAEHAMTVWVVWFQQPAECDPANPTCQSGDLEAHGGSAYGGGGYVEADGSFCAAFSLETPQALEPADDENLRGYYSNAYDEDLGKYQNYAIHVVARTHGPARNKTERYLEQLAGLNTACKPEEGGCANIAHSLHERRYDTTCK